MAIHKATVDVKLPDTMDYMLLHLIAYSMPKERPCHSYSIGQYAARSGAIELMDWNKLSDDSCSLMLVLMLLNVATST
jgi:hypothetical protein